MAKQTYCIDCGEETTEKPGSARCEWCWDCRIGEQLDFKEYENGYRKKRRGLNGN